MAPAQGGREFALFGVEESAGLERPERGGRLGVPMKRETGYAITVKAGIYAGDLGPAPPGFQLSREQRISCASSPCQRGMFMGRRRLSSGAVSQGSDRGMAPVISRALGLGESVVR